MMPLNIHGHEVTLFWNLMGFGQGKYKLQLLVTMELPHKWRDFNLAESGGNTHTVGKTGHHSIFRPVQSKMIPPSNHQVKVLHMKLSLIKEHHWVRTSI